MELKYRETGDHRSRRSDLQSVNPWVKRMYIDQKKLSRVATVLNEPITVTALASACSLGLAGAFIGLTSSSMWVDELFTTWVVGHNSGVADVVKRAITDVHPPLYYASVSTYTRIFGDSDATYRAFSAICACSSILIFIFTTGRYFSLPARLFAAAIAVGSLFWFEQSQNARPYPLAMLAGAVMLTLAVGLVKNQGGPERKVNILMLLTLVVLGSLIHLYMVILGIALFIILSLFVRQSRVLLLLSAALTFLAGAAYVIFVIDRYTLVSTGNTWYGSDTAWYIGQLKQAIHDSLNKCGIVVVCICLLSVLLQLGARFIVRFPRAGKFFYCDRTSLMSRFSVRILSMCLGVVVAVTIGGVTSSLLTSPSFSGRNLLVASPFLWGSYAALYEVAVPPLAITARLPTNLILSALVLFMATIVGTRNLPHNEDFRQSAMWIETFSKCRGAEIPVIDVSRISWTKAGHGALVTEQEYARYLGIFAKPRIVFAETILSNSLPPDLVAELRRRNAGIGCGVLGWSAHNMTPAILYQVTEKLRAILGDKSSPQLMERVFKSYTLGIRPTLDGPSAYVLYVAPKSAPKLERR